MNRAEIVECFDRIKGNVNIAELFLAEEQGDIEVALEVLGRCNIIEAKVAQIRRALAQETHGERPDNVHVLGDRPSPDAA